MTTTSTDIKDYRIINKIGKKSLKVANQKSIFILKTSPENVAKYAVDETIMVINPISVARGIIKENLKFPLQRRSKPMLIPEKTLKQLEENFQPESEDSPTGFDVQDSGQNIGSLQGFLTGEIRKTNAKDVPFRCLHIRSDTGQRGIIFDYALKVDVSHLLGSGISITRLFSVSKESLSFRTTRASVITACPGNFPVVAEETLFAKLVAFNSTDQPKINLIFEAPDDDLVTITFPAKKFGSTEQEAILQIESLCDKRFKIEFDKSERGLKYGVRMTET